MSTYKAEGQSLKMIGDWLLVVRCPDCGERFDLTRFNTRSNTRLNMTRKICRCGLAWNMKVVAEGTKDEPSTDPLKYTAPLKYSTGGEL